MISKGIINQEFYSEVGRDNMNMKDVISLVNTNRGDGRKENLKRMTRLMEKLGNPHKQSKYVHIAGTNGKGTTSAFMASILQAAGLKTGLFISPHLEVINERIRINNEYISDQDFISATETVAPFVDEVEKELGETLYSFEILTAVAFVYFSRQACDIIVLETGIGGRLDSTNVIDTPEVAMITSIGLDHVGMLGNTIEEIAKEKSGIIKENGSIAIFSASKKIRDIFEKKTIDEKGTLKIVDSQAVKITETSINGEQFTYGSYGNFSLQMIGEHQVKNACLAIEAAIILQEKGWPITLENIKNGLKQSKWPGRMEKINHSPLIIIDGAHNEQGVDALSHNLEKLFPDKKLTFIVGMMKDKAYERMIGKIEEKAKKMYFVSPDPWRGFDAKEVSESMKNKEYEVDTLESVDETIDLLKDIPESETVIVFGSLYLIGDIRKNWM
jgi:dihydrofolate synthase/folylpolyglutamate synthase